MKYNIDKEMQDLARRKVESTFSEEEMIFALETLTSEEAAAVKNCLVEAVASLETLEIERGVLKDIKDRVKEDFGIDKKVFGTLATEIQKGKFETNKQYREDVAELHDVIQTVPIK
jgi:hypothetical protein